MTSHFSFAVLMLVTLFTQWLRQNAFCPRGRRVTQNKELGHFKRSKAWQYVVDARELRLERTRSSASLAPNHRASGPAMHTLRAMLTRGPDRLLERAFNQR